LVCYFVLFIENFQGCRFLDRQISLRSGVGDGSTFTVVLPVADGKTM